MLNFWGVYIHTFQKSRPLTQAWQKLVNFLAEARDRSSVVEKGFSGDGGKNCHLLRASQVEFNSRGCE